MAAVSVNRAIALGNRPPADVIGQDFCVTVLPHDIAKAACQKDDFLWFKVKAVRRCSVLKG